MRYKTLFCDKIISNTLDSDKKYRFDTGFAGSKAAPSNSINASTRLQI